MGVLSEPLQRLEEYQQIRKNMGQDRYPIAVSGCVDSQKGHFIANLGDTFSCRLIVTWREEKARALYEDLSFFDRGTVLYPSKDILFYSADVHSNNTVTERMRILKKLMEGQPLTIVACLDVFMEKMIPPAAFQEECLKLDYSSIVETDALKLKLVEMGYVSNGLVEAPGEFSVRGDIVDIFPLTEDSPIRIELWGEEIDSIRSFDAESQRSIENLDSVCIYPASEILLPKEKIPEAIRKMKEEYGAQEQVFKKEKKRVIKEIEDMD